MESYEIDTFNFTKLNFYPNVFGLLFVSVKYIQNSLQLNIT
jgi:hypothetical protein